MKKEIENKEQKNELSFEEMNMVRGGVAGVHTIEGIETESD